LFKEKNRSYFPGCSSSGQAAQAAAGSDVSASATVQDEDPVQGMDHPTDRWFPALGIPLELAGWFTLWLLNVANWKPWPIEIDDL